MAARLVHIYLPESEIDRLEEVLARHSRRYWRETVPGGQEKYPCLVQQRYTERLLDELDREFGSLPQFTALVSQMEAVLPPIEETPETELPGSDAIRPPNALERFFSRDRLSTDELYDDIEESLHIRPSYLATVGLSSLIAGLGMCSGQTAVVIGAMIIAPLLGPTLGLVIAATLGNASIGRQSAATLAIGAILALLVGYVLGTVVAVDPLVAELRNRTIVSPADIALALASGAAGALAFSRGTSLALVGVMIAVALVPPLSAAGIYLGSGHSLASANALFLFAINLVCVNVAGIATLLIQGLPPKSWRLTGGVFAVWLLLLAMLVSMMTGRFIFGIGSMESVLRIFAGGH